MPQVSCILNDEEVRMREHTRGGDDSAKGGGCGLAFNAFMRRTDLGWIEKAKVWKREV